MSRAYMKMVINVNVNEQFLSLRGSCNIVTAAAP